MRNSRAVPPLYWGSWGPYGYSPAYTAAAGGRSDLAREEIDPDRVRVLNVGRSFLGLGALTASLAAAALVPEEATRWLDNASVATGMWLVRRIGAAARRDR